MTYIQHIFIGEEKENLLYEKKNLNDNSTNEISISFLGNKTKREESDQEENQIKNEEIKNALNIKIKEDYFKKVYKENISKKKGRKLKYEMNKGIHTKDSDDNKMIKIKTYFGNDFQNFVNIILKNEKMNKLNPIININLKRDFNLELWDKSIKDIYLETKISSKYRYIDQNDNINIINKIYKEENKEIIKLFDLTYGEVFTIFIRDIKSINLELLEKIKESKILDENKFPTIKYFLNLIKEQEKKKGESDEFIDKYIKDIIRLCLNFREWFLDKKGRQRNKEI